MWNVQISEKNLSKNQISTVKYTYYNKLNKHSTKDSDVKRRFSLEEFHSQWTGDTSNQTASMIIESEHWDKMSHVL